MSGTTFIPGSVGPNPLPQDQAPVTFWLEVTALLQVVFGLSQLRAQQAVALAKQTTSLTSNPTTLSVAASLVAVTPSSTQIAAATAVSASFHPAIAQPLPPYQ